jgi:hypothetical protein
VCLPSVGRHVCRKLARGWVEHLGTGRDGRETGARRNSVAVASAENEVVLSGHNGYGALEVGRRRGDGAKREEHALCHRLFRLPGKRSCSHRVERIVEEVDLTCLRSRGGKVAVCEGET